MYTYQLGKSRLANLDAALALNGFQHPDVKRRFWMRNGHQAWSIGMTKLVMAARDSEEIPTLRFDCFDNLPAFQIRPIAFMLVRPFAPTMT